MPSTLRDPQQGDPATRIDMHSPIVHLRSLLSTRPQHVVVRHARYHYRLWFGLPEGWVLRSITQRIPVQRRSPDPAAATDRRSPGPAERGDPRSSRGAGSRDRRTTGDDTDLSTCRIRVIRANPRPLVRRPDLHVPPKHVGKGGHAVVQNQEGIIDLVEGIPGQSRIGRASAQNVQSDQGNQHCGRQRPHRLACRDPLPHRPCYHAPRVSTSWRFYRAVLITTRELHAGGKARRTTASPRRSILFASLRSAAGRRFPCRRDKRCRRQRRGCCPSGGGRGRWL
jgi:hypothetical protein